jgi:RNA polymerase sigma-70 factor (ECF subfamily)
MNPIDENSAEKALARDVIGALVENHRQFLGFLERRLGNRALAEDILQEAFVRGMDKVGSLQNQESAVAWFYRVLRNSVADHHRRLATADRKLERFAAELEQEGPPPEVHAVACQCVKDLAGTLKSEYADALRRVEVDGVAVKDYAAEAGITSNNAAVRLFRAREALRKQVLRSCGTCADHGCFQCTCSETAGHCG